jgi:DNA-binding transcriptional MerR regulator
MWNIGAFAMASGLSINALRHYDEIGILRPAQVDPATGYRRYYPDQLAQARLICSLRAVDLPIEQLRLILDEAGDKKATLLDHRSALAEKARTAQEMIKILDRYLERGIPMEPVTGCRPVQIWIGVRDRSVTIKFYESVFGARYNESYGQFEFGTWPGDQFFLLTLKDWEGEKAHFGLLVNDLDAVHKRALEAGATEFGPPQDFDTQPRTSFIDDPDGHRIHLYQG